MSDLVKRLRWLSKNSGWGDDATAKEAADEIERLRAENEKLRAELESYRKHYVTQTAYDAVKAELVDTRAELAQRGEPVAHLTPPFGALMVNHNWQPPSGMQWPPKEAVPLYTAPPPRKPLSSAQIRAIEVEVAQSQRHDYPTDAEAFARAVERAHGIVENE